MKWRTLSTTGLVGSVCPICCEKFKQGETVAALTVGPSTTGKNLRLFRDGEVYYEKTVHVHLECKEP